MKKISYFLSFILMSFVVAHHSFASISNQATKITSPQSSESNLYLVGGGIVLFLIIFLSLNYLIRFKQYKNLKEKEEHFRGLLESTAAIPWELDLNTWLFTYVGPQIEKVSGYTAEEWYAENFWVEHLHPDDRESSILFCTEATARHENHEFEYRFIKKDGNTIWIRDAVQVILEGNKPVILRGFMFDITQQKEEQENHIQAEHRLAEAQKIAHLGSWELDILNDELQWSEETFHIFETNSALVKPSFEDFISFVHPDDQERVRHAYQESLENRSAYDIEHRLLMNDGRIKYVHERCDTEYNEKGEAVRSHGTVQDITNRRNTDLALQTIASSVSSTSGDDFFEQLVTNMAEIFNADYAFIGLLDENDKMRVNTFMVYAHGKIVPNISYSLVDTPCINVVGKVPCLYPDHVQQLFPNDKLLVEMGVESYIGIPLNNAEDKPVGLVVVLDSRPMDNSERMEEVLKIFAARTEAELDRKKAEATIKESESHFRNLLESTSAIPWEVDLESWSFTYVGPQIEALSGYKPEEWYAENFWYEHLYPEDKDRSILICTEATERFEDHEFEYRFIKKDGSIIWIRDSVQVIVENNKAVMLRGFMFDITQQKKKEEEQKIAQIEQIKSNEIIQKLSLAVEQSPNSIIITDARGKIEYVNPAFTETTGYSIDEVINKNPSLLQSGETPGEVYADLWKTLKAGEVWSGTFYNSRSNGEIYIDQAKISPIKNTQGEITHFLGVQSDVTNSVQIEQQLRRSQKMDALGKLTGGIAHDYNNMLNVITGYTELMELFIDTNDIEKLKEYIKEIQHASDRGARLTKKLLAFSRQDSTEPEVVDLNQLLHDDKNMLSKTLTARVSLEYELSEDAWPIYLDKGDLEDAILNMCINSMHAMENGGSLIISTYNRHLSKDDAAVMNLASGDYTQLSLRDTGCGIDAQTLNQIFDPFFTTKGELGTGLGLTQVYGFVKRAKGAITIDSHLNEGTYISLYFPRHLATKIEEEVISDELKVESGTETILVVDDEVSIRTLANELLKNKGYNVLLAEDGKTALDIMEKNKIDLMISDVVMPGMDGYKLSAKVRTEYPHVKIQLISGYSDNRSRTDEDERLNETMLHKPFKAASLYDAVRNRLDEA